MRFVQFASLRDLVLFVASSPPGQAIQYISVGSEHIFFIVGGSAAGPVLICARHKDFPGGQWITHSPFSGAITFSQNMTTTPNVANFAICRIIRQDFIPIEVLRSLVEPG